MRGFLSFLRADLSLDNMTCSFPTCSVHRNAVVMLCFISIWNTTMIVNRVKAILTEVYATATWPFMLIPGNCIYSGRCQDTKVEEEGVLNYIQIPCLVDTTSKCHIHKQGEYCYNDCQKVNVSTSFSTC